MAGVVPYLATSMQTVFLSYEINRAAALGDGLIFSGQSAELMLHMLEPIQIGYGAVVSNPESSLFWVIRYKFANHRLWLDPFFPRCRPLGS